MALIECKECQSVVSDKAMVCMKCGAPIAGASATPTPVVVKREPRFKWWLWVPLGLIGSFAAVVLFGASISRTDADANAFRRVCPEFIRQGMATPSDCDRAEASIRYPVKPEPSPPVIGVTTADIDAALADGKAEAAKPSKPVEWPKPPANLFEGPSK